MKACFPILSTKAPETLAGVVEARHGELVLPASIVLTQAVLAAFVLLTPRKANIGHRDPGQYEIKSNEVAA